MTDSDLIDALGGPARLAERLHLTPIKGRVQRVHNWRTRGIPARIKLDNPDVFATASSVANDSPAATFGTAHIASRASTAECTASAATTTQEASNAA